MQESVIVTEASGTDIAALLERKLIPCLQGEPLGVASAAMLQLIVTSMRPDIEVEDLVGCIEGASAWITLYLAGLGGEQVSH